MDAQHFITRIKARGFTVLVIPPDRLEVAPASELSKEQRQFIRQHKPELLQYLIKSTKTLPRSYPPSACLGGLAGDLSAEFQAPVAEVLAILDDDDRRAITTGGDPLRAEAWRAAVRALAERGQWG